MNGLGWQDAVAAFIVACAVAYLAWRKVRASKGTAACDNCPGCEAPVSTPGLDERRTAELPILRITADKGR